MLLGMKGVPELSEQELAEDWGCLYFLSPPHPPTHPHGSKLHSKAPGSYQPSQGPGLSWSREAVAPEAMTGLCSSCSCTGPTPSPLSGTYNILLPLEAGEAWPEPWRPGYSWNHVASPALGHFCSGGALRAVSAPLPPLPSPNRTPSKSSLVPPFPGSLLGASLSSMGRVGTWLLLKAVAEIWTQPLACR